MAAAVRDDWRRAPLSPVDAALCEFADVLTREPASVGDDDIEALRRHGLSDAAIHDAVQVIAYFNYINRVADALGCDLEDWMPPPTRAR